MKKGVYIIAVALAVVAVVVAYQARSKPGGEVTADEAKADIRQAAESAAKYADQKREEHLAKIAAELAEAKARLTAETQDAKAELSEAAKEARRQFEARYAEAEKEFERLKTASAETWEKARETLDAKMNELRGYFGSADRPDEQTPARGEDAAGDGGKE